MRSRSWLTWLVIVFGVLWAIAMAQDIETVAETARWPTTPGTIVSSALSRDMIRTYMGRYSRVRPVFAYRLHLQYAYSVAGSQYTGWRWNALPPSTNQATHAMLRKVPAGRAVVVHYDPRDPVSSVIDTSLPIFRCLQLGVALLLAIGTWVTTRRRH